MGKKKISKKQERSSQKRKGLKVSDFKGASRVKPSSYLIDEQNVGLAILECLQNNDPEGVMEVVAIYIDAMNKAKLIEAGEIPKSTFYHSLKNKNPTLKTLAKMVSSYTHADV